MVGASAWISSTMIVSTPRSRSRDRPASNRYSDSGVVIRICAGCLRCRSRSRAGVSPVRTSTVIAPPAPSRCSPASGARRLRSTSYASALIGETYTTRVPSSPGSPGAPGGRCASRSRHHRNAASVLPLPVGASISVWWPAAMLAQPRACTGVGAAKLWRNQVCVAAPNSASGSAMGRT